jgi:hypothetical protein
MYQYGSFCKMLPAGVPLLAFYNNRSAAISLIPKMKKKGIIARDPRPTLSGD